MNIDQIVAAAQSKAVEMGIAITISIVDKSGHLLAMRRMSGCSYFAIEASRLKAITSSQLKAPTHVLSEFAKKLPELQLALDKNKEVLTLPGGFPLMEGAAIAGGLEVAGGDFM